MDFWRNINREYNKKKDLKRITSFQVFYCNRSGVVSERVCMQEKENGGISQADQRENHRFFSSYLGKSVE